MREDNKALPGKLIGKSPALIEVRPDFSTAVAAGTLPSAIFSLPKNFTPSCSCRAITPGSGRLAPAGFKTQDRVSGP